MSNTVRSKLVSHEPEETVSRLFDMRDAQGRQLGARAIRFTALLAPQTEAHGAHYLREPGTYFVAECFTTRNGSRFGACQPDRFFKTEAERDAYIARRFADIEARYAAKVAA